MIHPDTEIRFINSVVGYGVVAKNFIPKGTITWVQDGLDRVYNPEDIEKLAPLMFEFLDTYCFTNGLGQKVLCWDNAKYVNHSFNPSCMSTAYDFEIAVRDIYPGEELTDDYGYLNIEAPFTPQEEGNERKVVYPDDLLRYHAVWDKSIRDNLIAMKAVDQPLQQFIEPSQWEAFAKVLEGSEELKSIRSCYFDRNF